MTPAELKREIESGPLAAACSPFAPTGEKFATGEGGLSWSACIASTLNNRVRPGFIPARWVSMTLARFPQVDGLVRWTQTLGTLPTELGGGACPFDLYCLLRKLERLSQSVEKGDLRAAVADVQAGLGMASSAGVLGEGKMIPAAFASVLLSGEVKISRVQEIDGLDARPLTEEDVTAAFAGA